MKAKTISISALFLCMSTTMLLAQTTTDTLKGEKKIDEVKIIGNTKKGSESNIITAQKKAVEVIERVGSVQLEKQGIGDVSVAVTKATGSQKQEGSGQIFIRGLGDRNNSTTINGLPIPSNDPMYKNLDLSIIKTDMIDFVGLEKVYQPKLWGDMSGANVDIVTKVYTGKPYFKVNLGSSVNTNAVRKNNFYLQDGPDYFGFKQVNRPSNARVATQGYAFSTSWNNKERLTPINSNLGVDFGTNFKIGSQGRLSIFGYGSFDNDYSFVEGNIGSSYNNTGSALKELYGQEYKYLTNTTGLLNINYRINPNHSINYSSNYIHTTEQKLGNYSGYIRDVNELLNENQDRIEVANLRRALYKTNDLFINQLRGEHKLSDPLKIVWNIGYNRLDSRRPDRQQNISVFNTETGNNYFANSNPGANQRYFDKLIENDYVGDLHADYNFSDDLKVTLGYSGRMKDSDFRAYQYNFRILQPQGNYYLDPQNYDGFFNLNNYTTGNLFQISTFWGDIKDPQQALKPQYYQSKLFNNAGYANIEYKFNDKFTGQLGLRYDNLDQEITYMTAIFSNGGIINKNYSKLLPSLNLKYAVNDKNNLRFSASKTYTTPLLIELAPYEYEEIDELSFGNVDLNPADNYNVDLKWEWFPNRSEVISVTAFGKYIIDPIARVTVNSSSNSVSFVNTGDSGRVFGVEAEVRKDLYQVNNTRFYTFLNASYINSQQDLNNDKVVAENPNSRVSVDFIKDKDKMQGASDFLANVNLGWEQKWGEKNAFDFVLSYSYISDNIYALGYQTKGNIVDKSINTLDAILKLKFASGLGISFTGRNLINPDYKRVQANDNGDVTVRSFKKGMNYGVGFSYEF